MGRLLSLRGLSQIVVVAIPVFVGVLMAMRAVDLPYWDEWEWADLVYKMHVGTLQFSDIWVQHGEHRIIASSLIMLGLARLGGWDPVREQCVSLGMLVLSQISILVMIRRTTHSTTRSIAMVAASLMIFGLWQWENLDWGFQMCWFICNACAIGVLLLLAQPSRRPISVAFAMMLAIIGSFTLSQGLIIWAAGAVAILLCGRSRVLTLAVWVPAAVITFLVYRHGLTPVDQGHFNVLADPAAGVRYMLAYLGSPLGRWAGARGSEVAGLVVVGGLLISLFADLRSPSRLRRFTRNSQWYGLAVFPILTAIATSVGRAGYGIDQGLASRYTTVSGLAWIALIGLIATYASRLHWPTPARAIETLVISATCFGVIVGASEISAWGEWKSTSIMLGSARAELAVSDPAALAKIYPDPTRVVMLLEEMRRVHDGPFAGQ